MSDVIDTLVGIAPGSKLDAIRAQRSEARKHAQASYASLFEPRDMGGVTADERHAVAAFVAGLHGEPKTDAFYAAKLPATLRTAVAAEVAAAPGDLTQVVFCCFSLESAWHHEAAFADLGLI